jgi:glycosyltransferase involved in cell wall biosynthesis
MRSIVASLDMILDIFTEVEVFATECDWSHPRVKFRKIPQRFKKWALHSQDYTRKLRSMKAGGRGARDEVVQVTGCYVPQADIRYMHFWNNALVQEMSARPSFKLPLLSRVQAVIHARTERTVARNPDNTGAWWVVSRSIAEKIKRDAGGNGVFHILPNVYDSGRFNASVRMEWREKMREHYGFHPDEKVLVFSAFGQFERKGLLEAVQATHIMRQNGHPIRLLVIGGTAETIKTFRRKALPYLKAVVFAGLVDNVAQHLSAADGLFFPSHFEAFSLAEIEAAALGLRLYLTAHHGHEMILRDPLNGRLLPWGPAGMAGIISEDVTSGILGTYHAEIGEAVDSEGYGSLLYKYYMETISQNEKTPS